MIDATSVANLVTIYNLLAGLLLVMLLLTGIFRRGAMRILGRGGDPLHIDRLVFREVGKVARGRLLIFVAVWMFGAAALTYGTWFESWDFHASMSLSWLLGVFYSYWDVMLLPALFRFFRVARAQVVTLRAECDA